MKPNLSFVYVGGKIGGSLYIFIYIYWRLEGKKRQLPPIGKSVSVSFRVRVVRACVRAKLCERVREVLLNAGVQNGKISASGVGFSFSFLMLLWWVLRKNKDFVAMAVGFK